MPGTRGLDDIAEDTPLLQSVSRSRSRSRRRANSVSPQGTASVSQAVMMVCTYFSAPFYKFNLFLVAQVIRRHGCSVPRQSVCYYYFGGKID